MHKEQWGCTPQIEYYTSGNYDIGRVISVNRGLYKLITENGVVTSELCGKFKYDNLDLNIFPTIGDFVEVDLSPNHDIHLIYSVLPRKSFISRKARGTLIQEQIIASNIDYIFIMTSINHDINNRRLERYLSAAYESNAIPIILLSKCDLVDNYDTIIQSIQNISPYTDVIPISTKCNINLNQLERYFTTGSTSVLIGSSGVGKSTLINYLLGENQIKTNEIRSYDDKGRHTTTNRDLYFIPNGGMIIDTPGMRSLGIWDTEQDQIDTVFPEIIELASHCKFRDCTHTNEPGCIVQLALKTGELDPKRYKNYLDLKREANYIRYKTDVLYRKEVSDKHKRHVRARRKK